MAPLSTCVTAALANASERRSIFGQYAQTPIYHTPVTLEAVLDEKGCLAVELPFTEAKVLSVGPQREVKLFFEPGDQLHIDADLLNLPQSLHFSGQGAANNQFLAALRTRFSDYLRINYKDLEVDAFRKMIDQRRLKMTRFLDEGCAQGGLTPAFVDYYRAEITYDWAKERLEVSYPRNYERQNGRETKPSPRTITTSSIKSNWLTKQLSAPPITAPFYRAISYAFGKSGTTNPPLNRWPLRNAETCLKPTFPTIMPSGPCTAKSCTSFSPVKSSWTSNTAYLT